MRIAILLAGVMLAAAMNVTHATTLLVGVDPQTGESRFFISSGAIEVGRNSETPGPAITLDPGGQVDTSPAGAQSSISARDADALISNTSNAIIEAILASKAAIDQENQDYIARLPSSGPDQAANQDAIDRINQNLNNLVGNIIKNAISQNKVNQSEIEGLINKINEQLDKKLDLGNVKTAQLSDQEKARQAQIKLLEAERKKKQEAQKSQQEQLKKQNEDRQAKLKEQLANQKAEKEQAAEAAKKKAAEEYAKKLSNDAAKAAFEAKQKALAEAKAKQTALADKARQEADLPAVNAGTQTTGGESDTETDGFAAGGTGDDPAADSRYDPSAPVDGDVLRQLVNGSPLPPITALSLAGMMRHSMALQPDQDNPPLNDDSRADDASKDKLQSDFVEQIAALERFPHIAAGDVSALPPTTSLTGDFTATYNGRLSGAFGDGTAVGASMSLDVAFDNREFTGGIVFDGGNGKADVTGGWNTGVNSVSGNFWATEPVYGGEATGSLGGKFYGPSGQELGGNWSMEMHSGVREGQSAGGEFATKQ